VIREIRAVPLTPEAFAPFGEVVAAGVGTSSPANQGTALRYDGAARLESSRPAARPTLAVYRSTATSLPFEVRLLEKHPASTQTFLPMACARFLVCVAPAAADGTPDVARLAAFLCSRGQGINYRRGVWHHPIVALDGPAELAMLAWEDGTSLDCTEHPLAEPVRVIE
jgi:ureidoglycolate lyase